MFAGGCRAAIQMRKKESKSGALAPGLPGNGLLAQWPWVVESSLPVVLVEDAEIHLAYLVSSIPAPQVATGLEAILEVGAEVQHVVVRQFNLMIFPSCGVYLNILPDGVKRY